MDDDSVTRAVLQRKKDLAAGKASTNAATEQAAFSSEDDPSPFMSYLNTAFLSLSLYAMFMTALPSLEEDVAASFIIWLPFTAMGVFLNWVEAEEALLPVIVAGAVDITTLPRNLGLSLANQGIIGVVIGTVMVFIGTPEISYQLALPLLSFGLSKLLRRVAGRALSITESCLIATGICNVIVYTGKVYQAVLISGFLGFIPAYFFVPTLTALLYNRKRLRASEQKIKTLGRNIIISYFAVAGTLFFAYLTFGSDGMTPFFDYILDNLHLLGYWSTCLTFGILFAMVVSQRSSLDIRRKIWHIVSVVMFLPTYQEDFTRLALAVAIILFLFLELVRASGVPYFSSQLHTALKPFLDYRDTRGRLIVSHIFLLVGIASPIFAANGSPAGIISLGLGDTFASQIGRRFGRLRWFGHKSVEGTVAFFVASLTGMLLATDYSLETAIVSSLLSALFEAISPVNDNLVVPLYMLAMTNTVDNLFRGNSYFGQPAFY